MFGYQLKMISSPTQFDSQDNQDPGQGERTQSPSWVLQITPPRPRKTRNRHATERNRLKKRGKITVFAAPDIMPPPADGGEPSHPSGSNSRPRSSIATLLSVPSWLQGPRSLHQVGESNEAQDTGCNEGSHPVESPVESPGHSPSEATLVDDAFIPAEAPPIRILLNGSKFVEDLPPQSYGTSRPPSGAESDQDSEEPNTLCSPGHFCRKLCCCYCHFFQKKRNGDAKNRQSDGNSGRSKCNVKKNPENRAAQEDGRRGDRQAGEAIEMQPLQPSANSDSPDIVSLPKKSTTPARDDETARQDAAVSTEIQRPASPISGSISGLSQTDKFAGSSYSSSHQVSGNTSGIRRRTSPQHRRSHALSFPSSPFSAGTVESPRSNSPEHSWAPRMPQMPQTIRFTPSTNASKFRKNLNSRRTEDRQLRDTITKGLSNDLDEKAPQPMHAKDQEPIQRFDNLDEKVYQVMHADEEGPIRLRDPVEFPPPPMPESPSSKYSQESEFKSFDWAYSEDKTTRSPGQYDEGGSSVAGSLGRDDEATSVTGESPPGLGPLGRYTPAVFTNAISAVNVDLSFRSGQAPTPMETPSGYYDRTSMNNNPNSRTSPDVHRPVRAPSATTAPMPRRVANLSVITEDLEDAKPADRADDRHDSANSPVEAAEETAASDRNLPSRSSADSSLVLSRPQRQRLKKRSDRSGGSVGCQPQ